MPLGIEIIGFKDDLHPAALPVREPARVRVMREHVPVLDCDDLADSVGHLPVN
jgi:hypothetical protein